MVISSSRDGHFGYGCGDGADGLARVFNILEVVRSFERDTVG